MVEISSREVFRAQRFLLERLLVEISEPGACHELLPPLADSLCDVLRAEVLLELLLVWPREQEDVGLETVELAGPDELSLLEVVEGTSGFGLDVHFLEQADGFGGEVFLLELFAGLVQLVAVLQDCIN